eukprot:m.191771 g.191771  ORF g.191771 m.191771 type:complete len:155 (+) comp10596_c0_seq13:1691-2155(+)
MWFLLSVSGRCLLCHRLARVLQPYTWDLTQAGQRASFALAGVDEAVILHSGQALLHPAVSPKSFSRFKAQILTLNDTIPALLQHQHVWIYVGGMRQLATLQEIDGESTADSPSPAACHLLCTLRHPEFLMEGSKVLLRAGQILGSAVITNLDDA